MENVTITRINPMGLTYNLFHEGIGKTKIVYNGKSIIVECSLDEMSQRWFNWQMRGMFIQNAFDNLSNDEREFLITGITPAEWNEIFKDSKDE